MNYPAWDVPFVGGPWVIATIAIIHVLVSHFAVGGGLFLPWAERKALAEGRDDWIPLLRQHSRFFLVLTAAVGTVTGVGIWFSIGLASPAGTSALIHYFVFIWAIEWVFFLVEVTAAAVYYYTWNRVPPRLHLTVGWVYAFTSFWTLVAINGILTFMLTPGDAWLQAAGTGHEADYLWQAFLNPTYGPSLILRTLVCITLAGAYALVTVGLLDSVQHVRVKEDFARWSARWMMPAFVLMPAAVAWYLSALPPEARELLRLGASSAGAGAYTQVTRAALYSAVGTATLAPIVFLFVWRDAAHLRLSHAFATITLCLLVTGSTEMAREMLRKPYVISRYMYSNGLPAATVADPSMLGRSHLAASPWVRPEEASAWASGSPGSGAYHHERGELMFRSQCIACHTREGYRSMRRLLATRDRDGIASILTMLHEAPEDSPYTKYMPPLVGTDEEILALRDYLYEDAAEARRAYLRKEGLAEDQRDLAQPIRAEGSDPDP